MLTFNRIARGHQATPDGRYAVVQDGYTGRDIENDAFGGEWAAVYAPQGGLREDHNIGENLDWFPTAREAKEACHRHADRQENR